MDPHIRSVLLHVAAALRNFAGYLEGIGKGSGAVAPPAAPRLSHREERVMAQKVFDDTITPVESPSEFVLAHRPVVAVNGTALALADVPRGGSLVIPDLKEGDAVSVAFIDVDDKGNPSTPGAAITYTVTDNVPPPAPGAPTFTSRAERDIPDPAPAAPTTTDPAAPAPSDQPPAPSDQPPAPAATDPAATDPNAPAAA